MTDEII